VGKDDELRRYGGKLQSMSVHVDLELDKLKVDRFEDEGGATASLILSTSHASIHGWPDRTEEAGFFWLTIGSCREFNIHVVDRIVEGVLHPTNLDRYVRKVPVPPVHMTRTN
jgi:S-adenosylmethionine/arginine decarboxylase-like enzyme